MRLKALLTVLVLAAFAVSCDQSAPTALTDDAAAPAPMLDFTNNPDNGNVRIFRGEEHFVACWSDATNGLRACHSTIPLGLSPEPDCGLQALGDMIEFQEVGIFDPADPFSSWLHQVVKGEVFITVRDLNTPGDCFGSALVAEGRGEFGAQDNDIFGTGPTQNNNANAWGLRGRGELTTPDGSMVAYIGHARFTWNKNMSKPTSLMVAVR